jgi:hypothetical protein
MIYNVIVSEIWSSKLIPRDMKRSICGDLGTPTRIASHSAPILFKAKLSRK